MRRWAIALAVVGFARAARADAISLVDALVVREGQCVEKDALVTQVSTWLGRDHVDPRVRVEVTASPRELDATFVVTRAEAPMGQRRIRSGRMTCPEFRAALALAIATALEADVPAEPKLPEDPVPPPPPPSPPPPPVFTAPIERPPPPPTPTSPRVGLGVDALAAYGLLADGAAGVQPHVTVNLMPWLAVEGGAVVVASTAPTRILQSGQATQGLSVVTLGGCVSAGVWAVEARFCPNVWLGNMSAQGSNFTNQSLTAQGFYSAFAARIDARFPRSSPIGVVVGVTPVVPFNRWSLERRATGPNDTVISEKVDLPVMAIAGTIGLQMRIF